MGGLSTRMSSTPGKLAAEALGHGAYPVPTHPPRTDSSPRRRQRPSRQPKIRNRLGVALAFDLLRETQRCDQRSVDGSALPQHQLPRGGEYTDLGNDRSQQISGFKETPQIQDGGFVGDRFVHARLSERKPLLNEVDVQHCLKRLLRAAALWVAPALMSFDERKQPQTGNDAVHFGKPGLSKRSLQLPYDTRFGN